MQTVTLSNITSPGQCGFSRNRSMDEQKTNKYTSPLIQNECLEITALEIV